MSKAWFLISWSLLSMGLVAQELPHQPVITDVTSVVKVLGRGFSNSAPVRELTRVTVDVSVGFSELPFVIDQIQSIVVSSAGSSWTMDRSKSVDLKRGVFRLYGLWSGDEGSAFGTLRGRTMRLKVNLVDGRSITRDFALPLVEGATLDTKFYVSEAFTGLVTPYHHRLPSVPRVRALRLEGDDLVGEFTAHRPLGAQGELLIYDATGNDLWSTPIPVSSPWLNGGQGMRLDGSANQFRIPLGLMGKLKGQPEAVAVKLSDTDDIEPNPAGWTQRSVQYSGKYRIGSGSDSEFLAPTPEPPRTPIGVPLDSPSDWRSWALRLNGVLGTLNHDSFDELSPAAVSEGRRATVVDLMRTSWGIIDRTSLLASLDLLRSEGHRGRFRKQLEQVRQFPSLSDEQLAARFADEGWSAGQIRYVRLFAPITGGRSLLAWDFCRAIMLVRYGYYLGFLSEDEAWSMVKEFADPLGQSYRSWSDLGEQFIVGRMYWAGADQAEAYYLAAHQALVQILGKGGIWYQAPWPTPPETSTEFVAEHP